MKELFIRTLTGISLVFLVAGSILLGPVPFLLVTIAIYVLSVRELLKLRSISNRGVSVSLFLSGSLFLLVILLVAEQQVHLLWLLLPAGIWMAGCLSGGALRESLLTLVWLIIPISLFCLLGWMTDDAGYNPLLPLALIALVWINDTFAYLTGTWTGKHPMSPRRSPAKTWEGFIGGLAFTLLGAWLVFRVTGSFRIQEWLLLAPVVSLFSLLGDLFESGLKRDVNLKNTGRLLPGHGGVLDRFDSLFFAAPAFFAVILLIRYF